MADDDPPRSPDLPDVPDADGDAVPPVPPRAPTWAGRAEVPVRGPGTTGRPPSADWSYGDGSYADEPDGRRWWMPILIGVIALVLVTVLIVAGWVIIDSARRTTPAPPLPATSTPAATSVRTSAAPTTTAPDPTPTPTATAGTTVVVPPLVGLPEQAAVDLLEQFGLVPRIRFRGSDRPPGTVLETDPPAGDEVAPGDRVTLVIAESRLDPTPTAVPTTSAPPQGDG
ncbi:Stk1 family PASTA domain-containing Ser/Thr kinase [Plantactinospora soyae]|uniref:PASTA domain-containing protein n=1 Tax=Plantactinospora soyae TaxID=1544732 RepID=A0A927QY56_9ACTN|nr:PASTA domain-containing protein [Plantactinospora soyae]MBE1486193.1 hypothetical protein [Plantactinospora soyae]